MHMTPDWAKEMNCAVTVCDKNGVILYMNDKDFFGHAMKHMIRNLK